DTSMGLYGSCFVGVITAVLGGRPGLISGAAGSMAVVTTAFINMFGLEFLLRRGINRWATSCVWRF
ncbi:hypothetical protein, partial [Pseudoalteromonas sp. S2893]|uniref:hypothetical protein n=1 Tax=Pseudoalteromonas sp. S2893 TaxID=579530 RepID=UPI002015F948